MRPSLILAAVLACPVALAAADAPPPAAAATRPAADAAIKALLADAQAGRLEGIAALVPAELQRLLAPADPPPAAADPAAGQNNPGAANRMNRMRGRGFSPLARLAGLDAAGAGELAHELAATLGQIGARAAGTPAAAGPAAAGAGGMRGMLPFILAGAVVDALPRAVLADGLETRQTAAIAALWSAHAAWAAGAKLDDEAAITKSGEALLAFAKSVADIKPGASPNERVAAALAGFGHALRPFGLDGDAAFASATVALEAADGDRSDADRAVVVVTFTAYGSPITLPLRVAWKDGSWRVVADSPLLRWLPGGGGFGGMGFGNRGGPGAGPGRPGAAEPPPVEGPAPPGGRGF